MGSYSVLNCSTHSFLYMVWHCFSYIVEHSCLVVGWHRRWVSVLQTFSYSVVQTSVSVSVYSVSQMVAYCVTHLTVPCPLRGAAAGLCCTPPYCGAPLARQSRVDEKRRLRCIF